MKTFDIFDIQKKIGYVFADWEPLFTAFTHSSYANEHGVPSYERLEFLGDSIVNFIVADFLFDKYRDKDEGFLTKTRAALVSTKTLGAAIGDLELVCYMKTSGGAIQDEVLRSVSVKADLFEAIVGAIFVDGGGLEGCKKFVISKLEKYIADEYTKQSYDYKSMLFETCAQLGKKLEFCTSKSTEGAGFVSEVIINGAVCCKGEGTSKKKAEQNAAEVYYKTL